MEKKAGREIMHGASTIAQGEQITRVELQRIQVIVEFERKLGRSNDWCDGTSIGVERARVLD